MTVSTLTVLLANPVPSPETGLISIRFKHSFFECRMPRHLLLRSVQLCILRVKRANMQASALQMPIIRSSSFREYFLLKNIFNRIHSYAALLPAP